MIIKTLINLFTRDLNRLRNEIDLYKYERNLWKIGEGISNPAGNLCLHLIGNLNTYIGREIGNTDYIRNRELEFSLSNIPKTELIKMIDETIIVISSSLYNLTQADLEKNFPMIVLETETSTEFLLVHLVTHLSYHLGQINYHRRLLDQ